MAEPAPPDALSELELKQLIACHECDLLLRKPPTTAGDRVECPRCGYELYTHRTQVIRRSMALVIAALLLYVPANFLPIMRLNLLGQATEDTVWSGVLGLYNNGMQGVAVVVFLCSMAVPLLKLLCQRLHTWIFGAVEVEEAAAVLVSESAKHFLDELLRLQTVLLQQAIGQNRA